YAAESAIADIEGILAALWEDCTASAQESFRLLVERGELSASDIGADDATQLIARGLAVRSKNSIRPGCRMLQTFVRNSKPDAGSLMRLFGEWSNYRNQIRHVLELRLQQLRQLDGQ